MLDSEMPFPFPDTSWERTPDPTGPNLSRRERKLLRTIGPIGGKPKTDAEAEKRRTKRKAQRAARKRNRT
jgi:hypothetical protein